MRKNIIADKECQVSIINYRKDRSAFINMVSVIPIRGGVNNSPEEVDDVVYHIGFQVDLTEQPKSILSKLKDGTYVVNYSDKSLPLPPPNRDWRTSSLTMRGTSKDLRNLLSDPAFTASFQLSASTHASTAIALSTNPAEPLTLDPYDGNKPLHMFLLDRSPDFLHVVSLKGAFLYVAPAVRLVLGYDPDELVGRSLSEFCHPADCVPLMRELKEASTTPAPSVLASNTPSSSLAPMTNSAHPELPSSTPSISPRPVDLLFRMQAKGRGYVWIECRGRLHVEPGKGRKAIILSGRLRTMPHLQWGPISRAGGLVAPLPKPLLAPSGSMSASHDADEDADGERHVEREFWGLLSAHATFLYAGTAVRDVLGWGAGEVIGKPLADFVSGNSAQEVQAAIEVEITKVLADAGGSESSGLACIVQTKQGGTISAHIVLYNSRGPPPQSNVIHALTNAADPAAQAPIACQVKLCDKNSSPPPTNAVVHSLTDSVFEETDIDRSSSWQYELQQLKFKNQRLAEEVAALDASIVKKLRRKQQQPTGHAAVGGQRPSVVGQRMNTAYVPHSHTPPMNVRFVPGSQGLPRSAAHALPSASQPAQPSMNTPTVASQIVHHSSHPPPPPPPQVQHRPPTVQQIPLPPPSVPIPQGYEQQVQQHPQQQHIDESIYTTLRIQHSTESSLQGWSAYDYAQAGQGSANGSSQNHPGSFNGLPMKRTWNDPLRDPGGGGGA